ncbi:MAG: DNA polymerase III subunit [Candidatus Aminicenantes bacterium]|nr:DNA polymerase III subunit [Candidatus Aminicenantes bacterium]
MPFHDIAGNGRVKSVLRMALRRGRVPHALLFIGPRGVGKRATARALAQALNCRVGIDDACGECESCRAIVKYDELSKRIGTHPDVLEYELMEDKAKVKIDQVRELISLAYLKPMLGRKRVFIIDDADVLSEEAKNSLLKVLEEPPLFTHIILLSDNSAPVLPTIKSRCRILTFLPVSDEEVEKALIDRGVEPEKARIMALVVRGNLERALDLDWDAIEAERREAWTVFKALTLGEDAAAFLRRFAYGRRKDVKEEMERTLELLAAFGRDLALLGEGGDSRLLLNPDYEDELRTCAGRTTPEAAMRIVGLLLGAASGLDRNVHLGLLAAALTARWRQAADSM